MRRTTAGPAPVWTTAGPPTQRIRSPRSLVARIAAATRRTISPWGFSLDTWVDMNSKTSPERPRSSCWPRMPSSPNTHTSSRDTALHEAPPAPPPRQLPLDPARHGGRPGPAVADHDRAVHLRVLDPHPGAAHPYLGLE